MLLHKCIVLLHDRMMHAHAWLSANWQGVLVASIPVSTLAIGWVYYRSNKDLPPGPRFFLFSRFFTPKTVLEAENNAVQLREEFGEVVSGRMFSTVIIVLNSYDVVKTAYITHGDKISGRPAQTFTERIDKGKGIVSADGDVWQEHRRFVLCALRDFGFGKVGSESIIREELEQLCVFLTESGANGTKAVDVRIPMAKSATNVICSLVFGQRCGTEEEFVRVSEMLREIQTSSINKLPLLILLIIGLLMKIPGDPFGARRIFANIDKMLDYVEVKIEEHRKKHGAGLEADLIDVYLTMQAECEKNAPGKHTFTDPQLLRVIWELFLAGTDTVATMMRWALFMMATHPDVQAAVQQELSETLEGRIPNVNDRSVLKYTDAVLHEVHRFSVMLPLGGLVHRVTEEVYVHGYRFPKDAIVMANLHAIFRDAKLWPHPREFNPHNFYNPSSKTLINSEYLIAFMVGRRACPGESLAKQELFLFFAGLLQKFTIKFDPDERQPTIEDAMFNSFNRFPPNFKLLFIPRK